MVTIIRDVPPAATSDRRTALAARLRLAIARTSRRLRQEGGSGLSPSHTSALATIEAHGPLTPSDLARRERLPRPAITRIVARLETQGLLVRAADTSDGRSFRLSATRKGRELLARSRTRSREYLARELATMSADEIEMLEAATVLLERLFEEEA